jgi:hypothetical protein
MDFKKVEENSLKIAFGKNIHQHLDLIAGLPFEGFESFRIHLTVFIELVLRICSLAF